MSLATLNFRRCLACLLALCCLVTSIVIASADSAYPYSARVTQETNLRRSPDSTQSNVIARIPQDTIVTVKSATGNFLCVTYTGLTGYIFKQYAEKVDLADSAGGVAYGYPYQTTTKDSVNLRARQSTSSKRLDTIPEGALVTVRSLSGSWAYVTYGEQTGYARKEYLNLLTVVDATQAPVIPTLAPAMSGTTFTLLQTGSTGDQVTALQEALAELGYLKGLPDGVYGTTTAQAVIALQKANDYPMNGIADANLQAFIFHGKPVNVSGAKVSVKTLPMISGVTIRLGDTGLLVRAVQTQLILLGYYQGEISGEYDAATRDAVKAFQKKNSLTVDGLCGEDTQKLLLSGGAADSGNTLPPAATPTPTPTALPPMTTPRTTVRKGSSGQDARLVQERLIELGYLSGKADGIFGAVSETALEEFQSRNGLKRDGVAGASTYEVLFSYLAISADTILTPAPIATPTLAPTATPASITQQNVVKIEQGVTGDAVLRLQKRLTELGYYTSREDGSCRADDVAAIRAFQRKNGLTVDGIAGYQTQVLLYSPTALSLDGSMAGALVDTSTVLRRGSQGQAVRDLQERLIHLGYLTGQADGIFGTDTAEAVYAFQKRNGLPRDGKAGPQTLTALYNASAARPTATPTPAPTTPPATISSSSILRQGDKSNAVKQMQQKLIDLGYLSGKADGNFGPLTYQALRAFQRANALDVDGIAGKDTLNTLNSIQVQVPTGPTATPPSSSGSAANPSGTNPPSNNPSTTVQVSAKDVVYEYWYSTVRNACRKYQYATVYDYSTGISWQVWMFSFGKHAEAEPLTAADTAKMEEAFGGNVWTPKPVWVIFADGTVRMATTHSMPHQVDKISDNNFKGHTCIHFPRTEAQVTAIGPYATRHQRTVEQGWAETQAMAAQ